MLSTKNSSANSDSRVGVAEMANKALGAHIKRYVHGKLPGRVGENKQQELLLSAGFSQGDQTVGRLVVKSPQPCSCKPIPLGRFGF